MDTKVNYTVVGIFVVVLTVAFVVMFSWLSTTRHDQVYHTYLTYVHEDVTGLSVQTPVRYNGVKVGYVSSVELDPHNPQLVKLTLKVEEGTPITTSTVATLLPMGITGVIYVGLKALTPRAPLLGAKSGQKYPIIPAQPSLFMQLGKVLPELTNKILAIVYAETRASLTGLDKPQPANKNANPTNIITFVIFTFNSLHCPFRQAPVRQAVYHE